MPWSNHQKNRNILQSVHDYEFFQGLSLGLFEFAESVTQLNFVEAIYFSDTEKKLGSFNSHMGFEILRSH